MTASFPSQTKAQHLDFPFIEGIKHIFPDSMRPNPAAHGSELANSNSEKRCSLGTPDGTFFVIYGVKFFQ